MITGRDEGDYLQKLRRRRVAGRKWIGPKPEKFVNIGARPAGCAGVEDKVTTDRRRRGVGRRAGAASGHVRREVGGGRRRRAIGEATPTMRGSASNRWEARRERSRPRILDGARLGGAAPAARARRARIDAPGATATHGTATHARPPPGAAQSQAGAAEEGPAAAGGGGRTLLSRPWPGGALGRLRRPPKGRAAAEAARRPSCRGGVRAGRGPRGVFSVCPYGA